MMKRKNSYKSYYEYFICISILTMLLRLNCGTSIVKSIETKISNSELITIKGKIEFSENYCGGAAPPEAMLQALRKKKPLTDYKLYIRADQKNDINNPIIDSTMTNENGEFEFQLEKGTYLLISSEQKDKNIFRTSQNNKNINVDKSCLEEWWEQGMTSIIVEDQSIDDIYFYFKKRCFLPLNIPCLIYRGPHPP